MLAPTMHVVVIYWHIIINLLSHTHPVTGSLPIILWVLDNYQQMVAYTIRSSGVNV